MCVNILAIVAIFLLFLTTQVFLRILTELVGVLLIIRWSILGLD